MRFPSRARLKPYAQVGLIVALIVIAITVGKLVQERDRDSATTDAVAEILADACGAASIEDLRRQGLVAECRLAKAGELPDAIPTEILATPGADVEPTEDVIPDKPTASQEQVQAAVRAYFDAHPIPDADYETAIVGAVERYMNQNPAPSVPPDIDEVRAAVRTVLLANPPVDGTTGAAGSDGEDGAPGRGVADASLDGCDVVFTFSDGTTDRIGPLCGPAGQPGAPPTDDELAAAVAAYCAANGECRGPAGPPGVVAVEDSCQPGDGRLVTDVGILYRPDDQTLTITCETAGLPGLP